VIHGSIRPRSICLGADGWKLADAGLARIVGIFPLSSAEVPVTDLLAHLPPEVMAGRPLSSAGDVYALAAAVLELSIGKPLVPWEEGEPIQAVAARRISVNEIAGIPTDLVQALDPNPRLRPTARELFELLSSQETADQMLDEDVQFTVYKPRLLRTDSWSKLLVFVHKSESFVDESGRPVEPAEEVRNQAAVILSRDLDNYATREADSDSALARGTEIYIVPEVDGVEVEPPQRSFRWLEPIHLEQFLLRAGRGELGKSLRGHVRIYSGLIVIGNIPLTLTPGIPASIDIVSAQIKKKIFVSYSHRDSQIVDYFVATRRGHEAVEILQDKSSIATGEKWSERLEDLIRMADTFQLYWSTNAMFSDDVEREWRYALSLDRTGFIMPSFWEDPLPRSADRGLPPPELEQLHFGRLPRPPERTPRLTFLSGPRVGEAVDIIGPSVAVGRSNASDVVINDPYVSRSHARLHLGRDGLVLEDLGSASGTTVNGRPCVTVTLLDDGDVVSFAGVQARIDLLGNLRPPVQDPRDRSTRRLPASDVSRTHFDVGHQVGGSISNVGRDQYLQHVIASRESFAREIASTKTKARYLFWIGLLLFIAGSAVGLYGWHRYSDSLTAAGSNAPTTLGGFFRTYAFFAVVAAALNFLGVVLLVIGIVLRIVAASRRKRLLSSDASSVL
jgi:hypothetical protein